jgi:hypothetical protein
VFTRQQPTFVASGSPDTTDWRTAEDGLTALPSWIPGAKAIADEGLETNWKRRKINLSVVFAGQNVGVRQVSDRIWLVSFMDYDLGYFDDETCRLEPIENPFSPKVLPLSQEGHSMR